MNTIKNLKNHILSNQQESLGAKIGDYVGLDKKIHNKDQKGYMKYGKIEKERLKRNARKCNKKRRNYTDAHVNKSLEIQTITVLTKTYPNLKYILMVLKAHLFSHKCLQLLQHKLI